MQTLFQLQIDRELKSEAGRNKADLNTWAGKKHLSETIRKNTVKHLIGENK